MDYKETLDWMFAQLPMYQRQGKVAFKKDLTNSLALSDQLGNPELKYKVIHVAGTNGKGSTSHLIASVLQEAGYKVGLYTSPHLKDFRERIRINGQMISKKGVITFIEDNRIFFEKIHPSFFEMTVGMAFDWFAKNDIDIAVVEVGLGGRLDSTNIVRPLVSVITNIGYDHMQFLGNTLREIAFEKAGIIKEQTPVVIGEYQEEVISVFERIAYDKNTLLSIASIEVEKAYETDLKGVYQNNNVRTAVQTIEILRTQGISVPEIKLIDGLKKVVQNTGIMGRWQKLQDNPVLVCDTAHNKEGLCLVLAQLMQQNFSRLHIVIGLVNDKNTKEILGLFPVNATYYFCEPAIPRALNASLLKDSAMELGLKGEVYTSVAVALKAAKQHANTDDLIFVGGSTFVVAEVV